MLGGSSAAFAVRGVVSFRFTPLTVLFKADAARLCKLDDFHRIANVGDGTAGCFLEELVRMGPFRQEEAWSRTRRVAPVRNILFVSKPGRKKKNLVLDRVKATLFFVFVFLQVWM